MTLSRSLERNNRQYSELKSYSASSSAQRLLISMQSSPRFTCTYRPENRKIRLSRVISSTKYVYAFTSWHVVFGGKRELKQI